jgi:hypothetical protein
LQKDEPLFKVHLKIDVPPLREAELRVVVRRPAELLSAQFETAGLADVITRRTAEDSVKDVGALPLLSYTLDDMWTQMVKRGDGVLRLPAQSFELGGVPSAISPHSNGTSSTDPIPSRPSCRGAEINRANAYAGSCPSYFQSFRFIPV